MATDAVGHDPAYVLPPELLPNIDHIVTEDDEPLDGIFSEKQQRLLAHALHASWAGPKPGVPFVAMANVGLFYHLRRPPIVPDIRICCLV